MKQNGPEIINTNFTLPVQLLEKFKLSKQVEEMAEVMEALKRGNPTEFQLEVALSEIRPLLLRIKSLTQPEYAKSFLKRDMENEAELASHKEQLKEAHKTLKTALVKINPEKRDNYVDIL